MKVYTAFLYDPEARLHVTHKYLGEQRQEEIDRIDALLEYYFDTPREFPCILFNQRDWFGPKKDIAVLRPDPVVRWEDALFPDLRALLEGYRPDDFGAYAPHVTTEAAQIYMPFKYYALMSGDKILRKFR